MKADLLFSALSLFLYACIGTPCRAQSLGNGYAEGAQYFGNSLPRNTTHSTPALSYFAGRSGAHMVARPQAPVAMPAPRPVQVGGTAKPFANLRRGPTISPYLSLDVRESATGIPAYYNLVKPQLEQFQYNQAMDAQNAQLQQQLRSATATGIISQSTSGGIPTTGHSTQFMNLGGYYPGLR